MAVIHYKKIVLLLLLVVLLFVVSCTQSAERQATFNFKQGVAELTYRFLENAPPEKIFPQSDFKFILEFHNQAAYDINNAVLNLVGINNRYFQVPLQEVALEPLEGRSLVNPAGDKTLVELDGTALSLVDNAEQYVNNYFIKLGYDSTMDFDDTVCINPNLYAVYDAGCMVNDQRSYAGQGAPFAITSMEQITLPGASASAEFYLQIRNHGQGELKNAVLTRAMLGGEPITCTFQGPGANINAMEFTKERQQALLICRKPLRDQQSYTTTLQLSFTYKYERIDQFSLRLVNPVIIGRPGLVIG